MSVLMEMVANVLSSWLALVPWKWQGVHMSEEALPVTDLKSSIMSLTVYLAI